jgi:hypothetical protein
VNVVGITDVKNASGAYFEGYIVSKYGSIDVPRSGFKNIHCDSADPLGYLTTIMTIRSNFVSTSSLLLNVGSFIWVLNFRVTFINMIEKGDWEFVLKVGAITIIEHINIFLVYLRFVPTHSILDFMQKENLEELGTMELVVIGIYQGFYSGSYRWVGQ